MLCYNLHVHIKLQIDVELVLRENIIGTETSQAKQTKLQYQMIKSNITLNDHNR